MKLIELMQTEIYTNLLNELDQHIPEKIDRNSKVHDIIMNLTEEWLNHASLSIEELCSTISNHQPSLVNYIIKKQIKYTEPNGGKDNVINHRPQINFPISHIIEHTLISKRPKDLLEYVAKIRIPKPKTYSREIEKIFSETKSL